MLYGHGPSCVQCVVDSPWSRSAWVSGRSIGSGVGGFLGSGLGGRAFAGLQAEADAMV